MTTSTATPETGTQTMAVAGHAHLAYIKAVGPGYAVFDASGRQLATFPNYDAAFFTARQYNLSPVNVH